MQQVTNMMVQPPQKQKSRKSMTTIREIDTFDLMPNNMVYKYTLLTIIVTVHNNRISISYIFPTKKAKKDTPQFDFAGVLWVLSRISLAHFPLLYLMQNRVIFHRTGAILYDP